MFCKHCGHQIDSDSKFCNHCGGSVGSKIVQPKPSPSSTFSKPTNSGINFSSNKNSSSDYDVSNERDITPTIVGLFFLIFPLIIYLAGSERYNFDYQDIEQINMIMVLVSFIYRIFGAVYVSKISALQNRNVLGWAVFAFFLTTLSLIIIGLLKKLKKSEINEWN